ncbi:hypothetical protein MD484_g8401, partial [Candolleomyces efflorescens]
MSYHAPSAEPSESQSSEQGREGCPNPIVATPPRPKEMTAPRGKMSDLQPSSCLSPSTRALLNEAGTSFTTNQEISTPYATKISEPLKPNPKREEHKNLINVELGELIALKDNGVWVKSLYKNLVSKGRIKKFLAECELYRSGRWANVLSAEVEGDLYHPYVDITNAILKKFVLKRCKKGASLRKAIDTNTKNISHQEATKTTLKSRPDVSIRGEGSCFQVPEEDAEGLIAEVGFSNMVSFQEMKMQKAAGSPGKVVGLQIAVYARQIFIHQPNRKFVRALLLTEQKVRLYHFDRSGGFYTSEINIHEDPHTFIRLVVGLNSLDQSEIGFDASIQWKIKDGRKVGGSLTTLKEDNTEITYTLSEVNPVITFFDIRGRGTQCWSVLHPTTGDKLLVKDCWKVDDRVPEYEHLDQLKGVQGIAQMLSFEPNRGETKHFRARGVTSHRDFLNRVAIRIVLKSYGIPIVRFKTPTELLCALRDAIKGHMNLYKTKRLHRDITIHNILIGKKADGSDADPGYCGILIDLYMAIQSERRTLSEEQRNGSRLSLSVALLKSCKDAVEKGDETDDEDEEVLLLAHDHLDDLEAFLYIYIYILHVYGADGASYKIPSMMRKWERHVPSSVRDSKHSFLSKKSTGDKPFRRRWPDPCIDLLDNFRNFIFPHVVKKIDIMDKEVTDNTCREVEYMKDEIDKHYDTVLQFFDKAIKELGDNQQDISKSSDRDVDSGSSRPGENHLKRMGGSRGDLPRPKRRAM